MDGMTFKIRSVHLLSIISKSDGFVGARMENITQKEEAMMLTKHTRKRKKKLFHPKTMINCFLMAIIIING